MSKIRILIIDDEPLARDLIKSYISELEDIELVGECGDGFEGFKLINETNPDLVFLDIMMPKLTGFEMLELIENPPAVIFSTAYDEYAIKAFEQNAIDYLLKPYTQERLQEAVRKAIEKIDQKPAIEKITEAVTNEELSRIAVKTGHKIRILSLEEIRYLEAQDDYVKIFVMGGSWLKQSTMKYYETHLPKSDFLRVHRSYIVRLKEINKLEQMGKDSHVAILHDRTEIPVSRSGYSKLKEVLGF